jgi:hypothetical protein
VGATCEDLRVDRLGGRVRGGRDLLLRRGILGRDVVVFHVLSAEVLVAWLAFGLSAFVGGVAWVHGARKRMKQWASSAESGAAVHAFPQRPSSVVAPSDAAVPLKDQLAG